MGKRISNCFRPGSAMISCLGRSSGGGPPPGSRPLNGIRENGTPKMSTYSAVSNPVCGVGRVIHPAQPPANNLLAKQLAVKRAQTKNVRDVVGIPSFAEHVDADNATDALARFARLADSGNDFAQFLRRLLSVVAFGSSFSAALRSSESMRSVTSAPF